MFPKIHVSIGEESSGSGTDFTQGLRPRHRRERTPERPPSNSLGDCPFLRPTERVPEVPVISREHLPQLEKIQEVLPSRRDEAHFHCVVSRLITSIIWNFQRVLHTLAATQEVPYIPVSTREEAREFRQHPEEPCFRLLVRELESFPSVVGKHSRRSRPISRGGPLHRKGERNSRVVPPIRESPDVSVHSRETCIPFTASTFKPRIDSHHVGTWDSPMEKPRGKALWKSFEEKPLIP